VDKHCRALLGFDLLPVNGHGKRVEIASAPVAHRIAARWRVDRAHLAILA
jgi:hypothetical protein